MQTGDITLVAAVIAALVSIGNILLTAHLGRRTEIQKWLRDEGLPLASRLLKASNQHSHAMRLRAELMDAWLETQQHHPTGQGLTFDPDVERQADDAWNLMEETLAAMELTAPAKVASAARHLVNDGHMSFRIGLRPGGSDHKMESWQGTERKVDGLRERFQNVVRESMGLDRIPRTSR